MKKRVKFITCLLMTLLLMSLPLVTNAATAKQTKEVNIPAENLEIQQVDAQKVDSNGYCSINYLEGIGKIVPGSKIYLEGVENELYCTFEDGNQAIEDLKKAIPEYLTYLMEKYQLGSLTSENWKLYKNAMYCALEDTEMYNEQSNEYNVLSSFLDIYEDYDRNDKILESGSLDEIKTLLPYYSNTAKEFMYKQAKKNQKAMPTLTTMTTLAASAGFNVTNGVDYAARYATAPNSGAFGYFPGQDCTNFASQILIAGGVNQVITSSQNTGWWHKVINGTHTYSVSFIESDTFARYMGVGYTTTSNYNFSVNIVKGDFIAYDKNGNGAWDHLGFVSDKGSYASWLGYYDYKVAQHSSNYNAWASSSTNGWDTVGASGYTYARVRR